MPGLAARAAEPEPAQVQASALAWVPAVWAQAASAPEVARARARVPEAAAPEASVREVSVQVRGPVQGPGPVQARAAAALAPELGPAVSGLEARAPVRVASEPAVVLAPAVPEWERE